MRSAVPGASIVEHLAARQGIGLVDQYGRSLDAPIGDPAENLDPDLRYARRQIEVQTVERWTIGEIRAALSAHDRGMFAASAYLIDAVMGNARVQATLGQRLASMLAAEVSHEPSDPNNPESVACYEAWKANWEGLAPRPVLADIMRHGIMAGFRVVELVWDSSVTPWRLSLKPWFAHSVMWRSAPVSRFQVTTMDQTELIQPGAGKWAVYAPHGLYRGWIQGAVRATAQPWHISNLDAKHWANYNEVHGQPIRKVKASAMMLPETREDFKNDVANMGASPTMMLPQGMDGSDTDVSLLEATSRSWETFKASRSVADMDIVLAIRWSNLSTEVSEGSLAAASEQSDVSAQADQGDAATCEAWFYAEVARPYASVNFGNPDLAPRTKIHISSEQRIAALKMFAESLNTLRSAGCDVDAEWMARRYGLSLKLADALIKAGGIFAYHMQYGIVTVNEVRAKIGLGPIPGGDSAPKVAITPVDPNTLDAKASPEAL